MEGSGKFSQSYDHYKILCKLVSRYALTYNKCKCEELFFQTRRVGEICSYDEIMHKDIAFRKDP